MISIQFELKELILVYMTIVGFISYIPQIIRLIKQKSAEDHSITTWLIWTTNGLLYLLYLYLDKVGKWLLFTQLIEVVLISLTTLVILILRFKDWVIAKRAAKANQS